VKLIERKTINEEVLPGRIIQKAIGKDGVSKSGKITCGFGRYSAKTGAMEPHRHAEEVVYIVDADKGRVRYGDTKEAIDYVEELRPGMVLHFPELEWHVFEYEEGGFVDIMFIYGQVDKIRPEEME
jgi:hypothetical protein